MRIIIGGAGEVGRGVARALYNEGQDVVLIDPDPSAVKESQTIDAFVLLGDVTRREVLKEAGIRDAQVFIAATGSDERNMLACALARDLLDEEVPLEKNPNRPSLLTIARIHDGGRLRMKKNDCHVGPVSMLRFVLIKNPSTDLQPVSNHPASPMYCL